MNSFEPMNALESALIAAQAGTLPLKAFYEVLLAEQLSIPSVSEVQVDGRGLTPLTYEREGITRVAVFTEPSRAAKLSKSASFLLVMNGLALLKGFPDNVGLVLNPGFSAGLEMTPQAVRSLIVEFV